MSIKLSQINLSELEKFVNKQIKSATLNLVSDIHLNNLKDGDLLSYVGSPSVWKNSPFPEQIYLTEDGLQIVVGSPPTKELLAVDETVARRNTRNYFTLPVGGKRNAPIVFTSGAPGFIFDNVDAEEDERFWRFYASDGDLFFDCRNDANSASLGWLYVKRSGFNVDVVAFEADEVTINGERVITESEFNDLLARIEVLENA